MVAAPPGTHPARNRAEDMRHLAGDGLGPPQGTHPAEDGQNGVTSRASSPTRTNQPSRHSAAAGSDAPARGERDEAGRTGGRPATSYLVRCLFGGGSGHIVGHRNAATRRCRRAVDNGLSTASEAVSVPFPPVLRRTAAHSFPPVFHRSTGTCGQMGRAGGGHLLGGSRRSTATRTASPTRSRCLSRCAASRGSRCVTPSISSYTGCGHRCGYRPGAGR
jgi:hypothetical protein